MVLFVPLVASLSHKSATIYLGGDISYPTVGIHDYIVLDPKRVDPIRHGFELYKKKIYAYIDLKKSGDADIEKALQMGFENLFLDFGPAKRERIKKELQKIALRYPDAKLIAKTKLEYLEDIYGYIEVLCSDEVFDDKKQLEQQLSKYAVDLIHIKPLPLTPKKGLLARLEKLKAKAQKSSLWHIITLYTTQAFDVYGISNKNPITREVFTLVDTKRYDIVVLGAHRYGALPLEYYGYVQKLYDIANGLPVLEHMLHYQGVVVWLEDPYQNPQKLALWLQQLKSMGMKIVYVENFAMINDPALLKPLGVEVVQPGYEYKKKIVKQESMIALEAPPVLGDITGYVKPFGLKKSLLEVVDDHGGRSVPCAITSWGGYALSGCFMTQFGKENLWIVDPFSFFKEALDLQSIPAPDTTTQNGARLLFSHVDGDGIMNVAEFERSKLSGEIIYEEILKKYHLPHSISVVGAEIMPNGLYPKLSARLEDIVRKMYALPNVEGATHTFSHPFAWEKITNEGDLSPKYRLAPKDYRFDLHYELVGMIEYINEHLYPKRKTPRAHTVFWSGDCVPRAAALRMVYKNHLLNINGGDTTITNTNPYLGDIAPIGLERDGLYQIYVGAQNENIYTNRWHGPFWGFQKVLQTFALTDKPKRLKPIDIYYHFYSGSKTASLKALKRVFEWALDQNDTLPIFTSRYIPKAMDFFDISIAKEEREFLVCGTKDLHTLKFVDKDLFYTDTKSVIGRRLINHSTYLSLDNAPSHRFKIDAREQKGAYVLLANGVVTKHIKGSKHERLEWHGDVDLRIVFHLPKECSVKCSVRPLKRKRVQERLLLRFDTKKVVTDVRCE